MHPNRDEPISAPERVGTILFAPVSSTEGSFSGRCASPCAGEITVEVEWNAGDFPFDRYSRFVRHPGGSVPYTLDAMEFSPAPPGLRVGPWPGWRGIPEFPALTLTVGGETCALQIMLHGDERRTGILRAAATIRCTGEELFFVRSAEPSLFPLRGTVYRTTRIHAQPLPVRDSPPLHPRLLITPEILPELTRCRRGSHEEFWNRITSALGTWDLPFTVTATSKSFPGPQRLAGEDRVMLSSFVALLDPGDANVRRALGAYRIYCAEAARPDFAPLSIDTQSGEVLFQLCVGFDWLLQWMDAGQEEEARKTIFRVAEICRRHLSPGRRDYGQAHYLGCGLGLLAFSLLFRDDHPGAREWAEELRGGLDCALRLIPKDGSYPHGMNLWIYEFGFLLRWIEVLRTCTGEDLWERLQHLTEASRFRAATLTPDGREGITFGDPQFRTGGDAWIHYLIARQTGSGEARWTADALLTLPHEGVDFRNIPPRRRVYEFLYHDPAIPSSPPAPRVHWFRDIGQVFQRSGSRTFTFRAGPPLGEHRYRMGEYGGYGHSDPASGSFLLHANGNLLISGPGPVYRRDSSLHNVVTIGGEGMVGDSTVWLPDFLPPDRLPSPPMVRTDGRRIAIAWNGTGAYLPHLGVLSLTRSLFIDLDRHIFGIDTVRCEREQRVEWNLHSRGKFVPRDREGWLCRHMAEGAELALQTFSSPPGRETDAESGLTEFVPAYPHDGTRDYYLRCSIRATEVVFLWGLLLVSQPLPHAERRGPAGYDITCAGGVSLHSDGRWLTPEAFDAHQP